MTDDPEDGADDPDDEPREDADPGSESGEDPSWLSVDDGTDGADTDPADDAATDPADDGTDRSGPDGDPDPGRDVGPEATGTGGSLDPGEVGGDEDEDRDPGTGDGPGIERPDDAVDAGEGPDAAGGSGGPLDGVAEEVRRRSGEPDGPRPEEDLFEDAGETVEVDREELWRQVEGEDAAEQVADEVGTGGPSVDRSGARDRRETGRTERVVEKKKYCQNCEHFSPPPDVRCTHEGTDIAEMIDVETFRVLDCPIVEEDERLEDF